MSLVVVGVEAPDAPLELLERVAIGDDALGKTLGVLRDRSNLSEVVVLSTCLRTELYAVVDRFHEGVADLQEFLATAAGYPVEKLTEFVTVLFDDDVTIHLFEVAGGLRSAVLGESEVLGQVRRAAERAEAERASGPVLSGLFARAVKAGRHVRAKTSISRGSTSLAHVAVELAEAELGGSLAGSSVVVVGAGEVAEGLLRALGDRTAHDLVVANRTLSRAQSISAESGARSVTLESLRDEIAQARVVFVSTGAPDHVVDAEMLFAARDAGGSSTGPLLVVDMGMPRNVDPSVAHHSGVTLFDIEDLNARAEEALGGRRAELDEALDIVKLEVERFRAEERARGAAPVVSALRRRLEELTENELARHRSRLKSFDAEQVDEVKSILRDVLAKLAHPPTAALKEAAGTPRAERLVEALRILFDL
jgi:glutamyl-tRNA reductase